jgi:hypothetical protein
MPVSYRAPPMAALVNTWPADRNPAPAGSVRRRSASTAVPAPRAARTVSPAAAPWSRDVLGINDGRNASSQAAVSRAADGDPMSGFNHSTALRVLVATFARTESPLVIIQLPPRPWRRRAGDVPGRPAQRFGATTSAGRGERVARRSAGTDLTAV